LVAAERDLLVQSNNLKNGRDLSEEQATTPGGEIHPPAVGMTAKRNRVRRISCRIY